MGLKLEPEVDKWDADLQEADPSSALPLNGIRGRTLSRVQRSARQTLESLVVRDFRMLWWGFLGTWMSMQMQQVARGYLAYQLTGNALSLGLVTASMGLPRIVLSPIGGVVADRFDKKTVLLWTQSSLGLLSLASAIMVAFNVMTIGWLMFFGFLQGAAFSINMPARQAYLPQVVGKKDLLANAIALNSAGMNLSRIVGPALAGLLIAVPLVNLTGVYFLVALCYVWVWWSVYHVSNPGRSVMERQGVGRSLADGFTYVARRPLLIALMSLGFVPLAIGMPYINLMPALALGDLNMGSTGFGLLLTVAGVGSLVGTLMVAYMARYPGKAVFQLVLGVLFGLTLLGFGLFAHAGMVWASLPFLFVAGLSGDAYMALNSTLILTSTDERVYGRVMGVYMIVQSIRPLSVLPISALADAIGTSVAILASGGFVALFVSGVAMLFPGYRHIGEARRVAGDLPAA